MIKLTKLREPNVLVANKNKWTSDLMSYIDKGQEAPSPVKDKYNHADIKATLKNETHSKCMYCESYISSVAPEHIEHYRPKAKYPKLTFDWNNLGLACPWCNIKKQDNFDENCAVINPYTDEPENHFIFLGTMICHKPDDKRAQLTELLLDLNRPELMESRKARIDAIRSLIDMCVLESNPTLKGILIENIKKEMTGEKPYAMCVRSVVKQMINI
jgi:uncharacterized protein (TIGR02646 family)